MNSRSAQKEIKKNSSTVGPGVPSKNAAVRIKNINHQARTRRLNALTTAGLIVDSG